MSDGIRSGVNCTRKRVEPEHRPERLDQLGLGEARDADQQPMTAGQQGGERQIDDVLLAENDRADLGPRRGDPLQRRVDAPGSTGSARRYR